MSFLQVIFLWGLISIAVPILIALWNTQKVQKIPFGGYFLLRKVFEARSRKLRLLEILKLINRVLLVSLLVLFFANPISEKPRFSKASNGFGIFVDVGRALQGVDEEGVSLTSRLESELDDLLKKLPTHARGALFFVSDRCEPLRNPEGRVTASASEWQELLQRAPVPFRNAPTISQAVNECRQKLKGVFGSDEVFSVFISPLAKALGSEILEIPGLRIIALARPQVSGWTAPDVIMEREAGTTRLSLSKAEGNFDVRLIGLNGQERLGMFPGRLDLHSNQSVAVLHEAQKEDPWSGYLFASIDSQVSRRLLLWANEESDGFRSLALALRKNPEVQIITEIGGRPSQSPVIIYGSFNFSLDSYPVAWIFAGPGSQTPLRIRDQKILSPEMSQVGSLRDLRKAFTISVPDNEILIRKYLLLDPDSYEPIESFQDGAPSLLRDRNLSPAIQISPFDLEDLTTDLTLEATFIPYLYSHLAAWLSSDRGEDASETTARPLFLLPGAVSPHPQVVENRDWPGVYAVDSRLEIIAPIEAPKEFHLAPSFLAESSVQMEKVSHQADVLKGLAVSLLLELLLCLIPLLAWTRAGAAVAFLGLVAFSPARSEAVEMKRKMGVGVLAEMDSDRRRATEQLVGELDRMSNLDFQLPETTLPKDFWSKAVVVISQSTPLRSFSESDREKVRGYAERGGLLFFDDPLATSRSTFFQSVERELSAIFPGRPLKAVSKDDVVFRTFFLLNEVSGRRLAEPNLFGIELDNRWVVLVSSNDLLGAILKSPEGDFIFSVSPYGISQRILSERLLLNIFMYGATLNYKDDAIHLPHILKRRVK